jgi:ribosomal protein L40E
MDNPADEILCINCHQILPLRSEENEAVAGCTFCGAKNPPESVFCNRCGFLLLEECPVCGAKNPIEAIACLHCRTALTQARQDQKNREHRRTIAKRSFIVCLSFLAIVVGGFLYFWITWSAKVSVYWSVITIVLSVLIGILLILRIIGVIYQWQETERQTRKSRRLRTL